MLLLQTNQGIALNRQITFTQGTLPITCTLVGAPPGVTINNNTHQLQVATSVPIGVYTFTLSCDNCSAGGASILTVRLTVNQPVPTCAATTPPAGLLRLVSVSEPKLVTPSFVGMHVDTYSHDWDNDIHLPVPPPTYSFDFVHSHDAITQTQEMVAFWNNIEVSAGVYEWAQLDAWLNAPGIANKSILFNIYGTPAFYQKYPGEPSRYPDWPGIQSPPADAHMNKLTAFVNAVKTRYTGRILAFEVGNEPLLPWNNDAPRWTPAWGQANNPQNPEPFYSGTATDFANMVAAVIAGAGDVPVWVGGFVDISDQDNPTLMPMLNAVASNGQTVKAMMHGMSFHWYNYDTATSVDYISVVQAYKARLAEAGVGTKPIINTEMGALTELGAQIPTAQDITRWLAASALLDVRGVALYKHSIAGSGGNQIGNPVDTTAVAQAITTVKQQLSGKYICEGGVVPDGRMWVAIAGQPPIFF